MFLSKVPYNDIENNTVELTLSLTRIQMSTYNSTFSCLFVFWHLQLDKNARHECKIATK